MGMTVTDLACQRGGVRVIEGLGFTLDPGQILELRGPNGIGKTTLLRTLAGLQPPIAGQIDVDPETLIYASHADGAKATLTVTENLTFWAQTYGQNDIAAALDRFNLQRLASRFAGQLSAGQKRRLGLSRLLVSGRAIWLLDEPTVSLDTDSVALFREVLEAHCAAGGAALVATHLDLGGRSDVLDLAPFKAKPAATDAAFDEAFL